MLIKVTAHFLLIFSVIYIKRKGLVKIGYSVCDIALCSISCAAGMIGIPKVLRPNRFYSKGLCCILDSLIIVPFAIPCPGAII